MDNNIFLLPAALFPAIPLMMISFGNRYSSLSILIRKIHDELIDSDEAKKTKSAKRYLSQISLLRKRLILNRTTQTLAAFGFLINLSSMYLAFMELAYFDVVFSVGIVFFGMSILLFIIEIQVATKALDTHLEDLEEIEF